MRSALVSQKKPAVAAMVFGTTVVGMLVAAGCETRQSLAPTPVPELAGGAAQAAVPASLPRTTVTGNGIAAHASGGGDFYVAGFADVRFAFTANQQSLSGAAVGNFHFTSQDGLSLDVHGRVTCMTTDPGNPGRAWIGGQITKNESEHPFFSGSTSEVGDDAWFRLVDYGEGANALQADRITLIFFEPTGGFHSAQQFCDGQLWFPDDRVTNPLLNGNIQVRN